MDKHTIDLRSDTFTLPSPEMRDAIFNAQLGDDVFGEDPSVNKLEAMSAEIMGKEKGLFVPSGTMGNLASILTHCARGTEVILGNKSHTFVYEAGGISALGGIHSRQLPNLDDGTMDPDEIRSAVRTLNDHFPRTRLICLENTHNMCFGTPLSLAYLDQVAEIARSNEVKLHIDGARIFNAASSLDVDVKELAQHADSITFCLSKGLAAPVGSVICGSAAFIREARRTRKLLGGGMRQAGILAAAGIHALQSPMEQIQEDHRNARRLAEQITELPGIQLDLAKVQTNILFFRIQNMTPKELAGKMAEKGIHFLVTGPNRMRIVTHFGITAEDIEEVINGFRELLT